MGNLFQSGGNSPLYRFAQAHFPKESGASAPSTGGTSPASAPDTSSAAVTTTNRAAQEQVLSRAGRSPTILTAPDSRGGAYTATKLGSGN